MSPLLLFNQGDEACCYIRQNNSQKRFHAMQVTITDGQSRSKEILFLSHPRVIIIQTVESVIDFYKVCQLMYSQMPLNCWWSLHAQNLFQFHNLTRNNRTTVLGWWQWAGLLPSANERQHVSLEKYWVGDLLNLISDSSLENISWLCIIIYGHHCADSRAGFICSLLVHFPMKNKALLLINSFQEFLRDLLQNLTARSRLWPREIKSIDKQWNDIHIAITVRECSAIKPAK